MHLMPTAAELQRLVREELWQIWLDPFGVQFRFDTWCLSVQFEIEQVEADGTRYVYKCKAQDGPPLLLHRLLQKPVTSVVREELAFELNFENGSILVVRTEIGPYECGQLWRLTNAVDMFVF